MITEHRTLAKAIDCATIESYIVVSFMEHNVTYYNFPNFNEFLMARTTNKYLHEIICYQNNFDTKNIYANRKDGRLCFDFEIKEFPNINVEKWKLDVESIIKQTSLVLYTNFDVAKIKFVWSTSNSPGKISKHLTVAGIWYENWLPMSRHFYKHFENIWNNKFDYCHTDYFLDKYLIKPYAMLRFVGSVKPNGTDILFLDDENIMFEDSMVRPRVPWKNSSEQTISRTGQTNLLNLNRRPKLKISDLCTRSKI